MGLTWVMYGRKFFEQSFPSFAEKVKNLKTAGGEFLILTISQTKLWNQVEHLRFKTLMAAFPFSIRSSVTLVMAQITKAEKQEK